jgi:hypothetical protein
MKFMKLGKIGERVLNLENDLAQFRVFKYMNNLMSEGPMGAHYQRQAMSHPPIVGTLLKLLDEKASREEILDFLEKEIQYLIGSTDQDLNQVVDIILKHRLPD